MQFRLHHAQITIPKDAEAVARTFYCETLGLRETDKPAILQGRGGFWLQLDGGQIHIGVEDGVDRNKTKAHVAIEVADLNSMRNKLLSAGTKIEECPKIPGIERFEFRDPFGNRMEFLSPSN
jgi:catechol 2,3-dioxygenase-like lactoylglutathione lyase family enzyme